MMLILDTNVLSALRRPERSPAVLAWLARQREEMLYLSVVTLGEIERGITRQEQQNPPFARDLRDWLNRTVTLFSDRLLPFGPDEARIWGRLSARIGHAGADIGPASGRPAWGSWRWAGSLSSACRVLLV